MGSSWPGVSLGIISKALAREAPNNAILRATLPEVVRVCAYRELAWARSIFYSHNAAYTCCCDIGLALQSVCAKKIRSRTVLIRLRVVRLAGGLEGTAAGKSGLLRRFRI